MEAVEAGGPKVQHQDPVALIKTLMIQAIGRVTNASTQTPIQPLSAQCASILVKSHFPCRLTHPDGREDISFASLAEWSKR